MTIPKPVRDLLGIETGTPVQFVVGADGRVVLQRADRQSPAPDRFERARGSFKLDMTTDEIKALTRGDD